MLFPFQSNIDIDYELVNNGEYSTAESLQSNINENDVYKVEINNPLVEGLRVSLDILSSNDDADLEIYLDSNNNQILESTDRIVAGSGNIGNDSIELPINSTNTYFFRVELLEGSKDDILDYELLIEEQTFSAPELPDFENGLIEEIELTRPTANNLGVISSDGSSIVNTGSFLQDYQDDNVFKFEINEISNLSIYLNILDVNSDADLLLYEDSNNNGEFDINDFRIDTSENIGDDFVYYQQLLAGTYFVSVSQLATLFKSGFDTNDATSLDFDYDLVISAQAIENSMSEINTVYRFLNTETGVYFYTASEFERDNIRESSPQYDFEGASFISAPEPDFLTGSSPIYRFFNTDTEVHFYTISEIERDFIFENIHTYIFEGIDYFGYETQEEGTIPLYRLYNSVTDAHFYTPSIEERNFIIENSPDYQLESNEGIAFYVQPVEI